MIKNRSGGPRRPALPAVAGLASVALLGLAGCGVGTAASAGVVAAVAPAPHALQQQFVQVVKDVGPSVVLVQSDQGLGSGVVYDSLGDIVTNDHVVAGSSNFQVVLADGRQYAAQVVGTDPADDLAVLRINAPSLQPAVFADSTRLAVGDLTLAIGNPLGLQSSVTEGIISALGRTVNEGNGVALPNVIQTSASINPGNSGGALVNLGGQVIGIPTLVASDPQLGSQAPGIGFAIPSNTVRDVASQLVDQGRVTNSHRADLGLQTATTTNRGPLVTQVRPGGPAARAGIQRGDLITAVNGVPTPDQATLADVLAGLTPGRSVGVSIVHADGLTQTVQVTLGQYPG
jgi:putative serine protease PepD